MTLKTLNILLIEDNEGDILLTKKAFEKGTLEKKNFDSQVFVARNGKEGLDFLNKKTPFEQVPTPHIILLDLNMPEINGHELLKTIKQDKTLRSIPVIVLSTSGAESDIATAYDLQASSYVRKPVDFQEFADLIQKIQEYWSKIVLFPNR